MWIAEGIVSGADGLLAEKVAEQCFNQLVSRNLVQPSEFAEIGTLKSCHVHDIILSKSGKENFMEIGELVELEKLAICFGDDDLASGMLKEINALLSKLNSNLRTLTILHNPISKLKKALDEVVKITLYETRSQLQDLQVLRNLHTLVKLVLGFKSFNNAAKYLVFDYGGFTHLKFLEIESPNLASVGEPLQHWVREVRAVAYDA
ncbi:hypothetical protein ZIOFF_014305 [Zingiber officinale]|uniref:Disease resistance protein winged helix domain-containing protein n=1 Tax=Zingiber officinale TaxID=94328 RepID=A0A8J5HH52_ZINOF|nr:hypothetical protein ZIOFF_014305 [Zingiber officinale]